MSTSPFDKDRYCREVLDPATEPGSELPGDLLQRYAVPASAEDDAVAFSEHVDQVEKYWRGLQGRRRYKQLTSTLLAAHAELKTARQLNYTHFVERSREQRQASLAKLENWIKELAGLGPLTRARLELLLASLPIRVPDDEVYALLSRFGVRLVEPWVLPPEPSSVHMRTLSNSLNVLDHRLAAEVVLGTEPVRAGFTIKNGFRLRATSTALNQDLIDQARAGQATRTQDNRKTAADNVLNLLFTAANTPGQLESMLLWQLIGLLRPMLGRGLSVPAVSAEAVSIGLDPHEAAELALTVSELAEDPADGTRREIHAALSQAQLRTAQRLVENLPANDPLRKSVKDQADDVTHKEAEAFGAAQAGQLETAAELLTQAIQIAGDDSRLIAELRKLPPPPPRSVVASPSTDRVNLRWEPSDGYPVGLTYLVVRHADDGSEPDPYTSSRVVQTSESHALDDSPPLGEELRYAVFATRGEAWSTAALASCQPVAPEVLDLRVETRELAVFGTWQPHSKVHGVVVLRAEGAAPPPSVAARSVPATQSDFQDTEVHRNRRYFYRVRSIYLTSKGRQYLTPGVVADVLPSAQPGPVDDLTVERMPNDVPTVRLSWTPPAVGQVRVRANRVPPVVDSGRLTTVADLASFGTPLSGRVLAPEHGRAVLVATLPSGRSFLTAVTVEGDQAAIGATVPFAMVSPVTRVAARRVGDLAQMTWVWPQEVEQCRVDWPGGSLECGRRRYEDEGGQVTIDLGPRAATVTVRSLVRDRQGETLSVPVSAEVPPAPAVIRYVVRRYPGSAKAVVSLTCERPARLPDLVVVHSAQAVMPLRADQGTVLTRVPAQDIGPTLSVQLTVSVPRGFGPCWVTLFVEGSTPEGIVLVAGRR